MLPFLFSFSSSSSAHIVCLHLDFTNAKFAQFFLRSFFSPNEHKVHFSFTPRNRIYQDFWISFFSFLNRHLPVALSVCLLFLVMCSFGILCHFVELDLNRRPMLIIKTLFHTCPTYKIVAITRKVTRTVQVSCLCGSNEKIYE